MQRETTIFKGLPHMNVLNITPKINIFFLNLNKQILTYIWLKEKAIYFHVLEKDSTDALKT